MSVMSTLSSVEICCIGRFDDLKWSHAGLNRGPYGY